MSASCENHHLIPQDEAGALTERARLLMHQSLGTGLARGTLRGKNLALVCESDDSGAALLFQQAASELGARVAHVRPNMDGESTDEEICYTARLLGRLYDAIECQGLTAQLVDRIRSCAGVPVYEGLALDSHPSARLVDRLEPSAPWAERRRRLIQAVLLDAVG
jgi:ornithine carbamoyltransferase